MDSFTACEQAYKSGYQAGLAAGRKEAQAQLESIKKYVEWHLGNAIDLNIHSILSQYMDDKHWYGSCDDYRGKKEVL